MGIVLNKVVFFLILSILTIGKGYTQEDHAHRLWRIYEDNDFLNIRGQGTDKAYSGGNRLDVFIEKPHKSLLIPGALVDIDSMMFIDQWGIMQMIFTPGDISNPGFQPDDYFYSGALFLSHIAHAYSPLRRHSFQTEIQLGVRGPFAFGKETQRWVHKLIDYTLPEGWDHQLKNIPIININFAFEKQIATVPSTIEFIAGTKWKTGSLENSISVYPLVRIGLMQPYFNGYISRYTGKPVKGKKQGRWQTYIVFRPELKWTLSSALLQSVDMFHSRSQKSANGVSGTHTLPDSWEIIRHFVYSMDYGIVIAAGKFSFSFIQNFSTELRKHTYNHEVGNISIHFAL